MLLCRRRRSGIDRGPRQLSLRPRMRLERILLMGGAASLGAAPEITPWRVHAAPTVKVDEVAEASVPLMALSTWSSSCRSRRFQA